MVFKATHQAIGFTLALAASANAATYSFDTKHYAPKDVICRDVAIIGGGSSGVYAGVHLGDYNKTMVIIEKEDYLGGHAQTYFDPGTGIPIDIGVQVFEPTTLVKDYFARFNVSLSKLNISGGGTTDYANFNTGKHVNITQYSDAELIPALETYAGQLLKYPGITTGFNLTYPIAPDLLLPFGEFVAKYNLTAIMPLIVLFDQGYAPLTNISTLYMLKYFNLVQVEALQSGFLTTTHHDVSALYTAITKYLGDDVLLSSTVLAMDRSSQGVKMVVKTPTGPKLILSKKLVSAIPPKLNNLGGFDLSMNEKTLFSKWFNNGYYTGLLKNTGLSPSISYVNADPNAAYQIPDLPGLYGFSTVPYANLTHTYYCSPQPMANSQVQSDIFKTLARIQKSYNVKQPSEPAEFVIFESHTPFNLMVSNEDIQNGFYKNLNALQGQQNTFYTGAAFTTQDSSVIWDFSETYLLPAILRSL